MNVYIWTSGELKNAYIGEYGWKPWANTIAYYPLEWDANDYSWNWWNGTWTWNESYTTLSSWLKVADFPYSSNWQNYISSSLTTAPATVSFRLYFDNISTSSLQDWRCPIWQYNASWSWWSFAYYIGSSSKIYCWSWEYTQTFNATTRYYITITNWKFYLNGNELFTCGSFSSSWNTLSIWTNYKNSEWANYKRALNWKMSRIILESVNRTQEEISNYYNQTKSLYWIS